MSRYFSKIVVASLMALGLAGSMTEAAGGTIGTYNLTICADYVNYPVWLPPNMTIAMTEAYLTAQGMNATNLALLQTFPSCMSPYLEYVCSSAFPRVVNTTTPGVYDVDFACKSNCETVVQQCSAVMAEAGMSSKVPNCTAAIPSSLITVPPNGVLFQPNGSCNAVTSLSGGSTPGAGTNTGNQTASCGGAASIFTPDTFQGPGGTTTNAEYCTAGCCLKCPVQYSLYREGALETGFKITNYTRAVSMVLSFILMMSYICLPDKRSHPSALILFFAICVFLFSVVVIFPLVNTRAMQCADLINPSTQQNNLKCAIQGAILVFASVSTCAWCSALIINLHLHTVWNSAWFAKKYWLLHMVCWGFAIAVTAVALGLGEIKWEYATLCLISQDKAPAIFFYPMAAMIFPAFLIHIATFFHIARISAQAGSESETMSRSTLSAGAAAMISHRRHVMMAIRIQWRAAVMAICAILSVTFYWLFYFIQLGKISPENMKTPLMGFVKCIVSGTPHDTCADQLAPHLPPYGLMIAAEELVSLIGTIIFIVFFKPALLSEWADWFGSVGYLLRGKRQMKKEQDQFFVI
ncbi:hypothetical protein EMPS_01786 [Entomortierella parvispora]|uniref:G-protein coupled receptors family 2 profile 2 domain-containing protein n=1 Tax=Entomortierella parvispora TaxID=205924 RepID=A0A9P3H3Q4_9FUNG|nr:hypothetical protein EMPS_01786 [Entomortierella parvispora]